MRSTGIARIKCYIVIIGLEKSLAENILHNFDFNHDNFLSLDEQTKALQRFREDKGEPSIKMDDLDFEDFISYLDIGDLVNLLNRHYRDVKNALPEHILGATKVILKYDALSIRKRVMHPVRPLEVDDLPKLLKLAEEIQIVSPSLIWDPLEINLRRLSKEGGFLDITIPSFWEEDSSVVHNLPPAEFDDTGFIGRVKERKELRKLLQSEQRVITLVGAAGIGKTALALRVCNDIMDDPIHIFDRIVWVTLKTRYLTTEGIRQINEAIDSLGTLVDKVLESLKIAVNGSAKWDSVLEQLKASKILLVIDNLTLVQIKF